MLALTEPVAAKHRVLYEKFTNRGCNPCARFAPASDSLINVRLGELVPITYHGNYPDRQDPYYLSVKDNGLDARIAQYEITGYPTVILNGKQLVHSIPVIDDNLEVMLQEEQTMDLKLESSVTDNKLSVKVTATPFEVQNNSNLRLFVAAVEEECQSGYAGGPNFAYVVRQFLQGSPTGYDMGAFGELTPAVFSTDWEITNFEDSKELAVVAWIQDVTTDKVIECAYAPGNSDLLDAADLLLVKDTPDAICTPFYHATVTFRNSGCNEMTSCNICVNINGKEQKTPWQGSLEYLDKVTFRTPDFTDFDLNDKTNTVKIYLSDINGTENKSDVKTLSFKSSIVGQNAVEVQVYTDNKPEETSWELQDAQGNVLERSEPFTKKRAFFKHVFDLPADGCYKVHFIDTGGDGIVGDYGNGYFKLSQKTSDGKTKMLTQGDFGGAEHNVFFQLENAVSGVDAIADAELVTINGKQIQVHASDAEITVVDVNGKQMVRLSCSGERIIDCKDWTAGVYIISVQSEDETVTKTIIL